MSRWVLLGIIIILIVLVLVHVFITSKFDKNQEGNKKIEKQYLSSDIVNSLPSCTKQEVFSVPPLKSEDYAYIEPLGHLNPPSHHIMPSEWLSVIVHRKENVAVETNVYAPADITIFNIKHFRLYDDSGNLKYE